MLPYKVELGVRWAFEVPGRIQQHEWETRSFLELVLDELSPDRTVELGTWKGTNAMLLGLVTRKLTVSLDIHDYDRNEVINKVRSDGINVTLPLADCRSDEVIANTKVCLDGPIRS